MRIGLLRHGVAEDLGPDTGFQDEPRRLTEEGTQKMRDAAKGIATIGFQPDLIISSPLIRCAQTAEIVGKTLKVDVIQRTGMRPGASAITIRDLLAEFPGAETLLFCGHQPDMSYITADFTGGMVNFKKGGLAIIEMEGSRGVIAAVYPPRTLRQLAG